MQGEKLRWWSLYHEPEHELVGKVQLFINYSAIIDENSNLKVNLLYLVQDKFYVECKEEKELQKNMMH